MPVMLKFRCFALDGVIWRYRELHWEKIMSLGTQVNRVFSSEISGVRDTNSR